MSNRRASGGASVPSAEERRRAKVQFFMLFQGEEAEKLAAILGISSKQVRRLRDGPSVPLVPTYLRMQEVLEEARTHSRLTPAERREREERRRARDEEFQRSTSPLVIDGLEDKEIPVWFANIRRAMDEFRWADAIERIRERVDAEDEWQRVPERTRCYVLSDLALCYHKRGLFAHARDFAERAIADREARMPKRPTNSEARSTSRFLAVAKSNLGCSLMHLGDFEAAHGLFRRSAEHKRDYWPAYYNAVCAASLAQDEGFVTLRLGEFLNAASAFLHVRDIDEVVEDIDKDSDLVYARRLAISPDFLAELRHISGRRRAGTPRINPEGDE